jgi:hypothetical protein
MAAVLEDVTRWCDSVSGFRSSVRGVFIDQVAESLDCTGLKKNDACLKDYYQAVVDAINKACASDQYGAPMIMLNPGRSFAECEFMAANKVRAPRPRELSKQTADMLVCICLGTRVTALAQGSRRRRARSLD